MLAQINVARLRRPFGDPGVREFTDALDTINALAERSPGFIWRHITSDGHLDGADLLGDPLTIINLSLWASYEHLHMFTYRSRHGHFVRRRTEWFTPLSGPTTALWWVPAAHRPTPSECLTRLEYLRRHGPSPRAFTVRRRFDADGAPERRRS
ncbi:DUF3291 domain-containing protein [Kutzneria sp. NPDC051319]|uniref:DUF3291 domain-containing protein n=1 Tax=Kutzneria sp. NPDC051319 TaxID=3155047 RepID=UPI003426E487